MSQVSKQKRPGIRSFFPTSGFFDDFFQSSWPRPDWFGGNDGINSEWNPTTNIKETNDLFQISLSVPGFTKEDIRLEVGRNYLLKISGEKKEESEEEEENYMRKEYSYNSFSRSFQLPQDIDEKSITAKCENGILNIDIPKSEEAIENPEIKEIDIS
jgi:HSP20 family protein